MGWLAAVVMAVVERVVVMVAVVMVAWVMAEEKVAEVQVAERVATCTADHSRCSRCHSRTGRACHTYLSGCQDRHPGTHRWRGGQHHTCHDTTWEVAQVVMKAVESMVAAARVASVDEPHSQCNLSRWHIARLCHIDR